MRALNDASRVGQRPPTLLAFPGSSLSSTRHRLILCVSGWHIQYIASMPVTARQQNLMKLILLLPMCFPARKNYLTLSSQVVDIYGAGDGN